MRIEILRVNNLSVINEELITVFFSIELYPLVWLHWTESRSHLNEISLLAFLLPEKVSNSVYNVDVIYDFS